MDSLNLFPKEKISYGINFRGSQKYVSRVRKMTTWKYEVRFPRGGPEIYILGNVQFCLFWLYFKKNLLLLGFSQLIRHSQFTPWKSTLSEISPIIFYVFVWMKSKNDIFQKFCKRLRFQDVHNWNWKLILLHILLMSCLALVFYKIIFLFKKKSCSTFTSYLQFIANNAKYVTTYILCHKMFLYSSRTHERTIDFAKN